MKALAVLPLLLCTAALSGCASLPAAGPSASTIDRPEERKGLGNYEIMDITPQAIGALSFYQPASLFQRFHSRAPAPGQMFSVGDQVVVNIYEASAGGLFSGPVNAVETANKATTLPVQSVDQDGAITVPYAGRVRAAGRTPAQVGQTIVDRIKDKASEPQVIVSLVQTGAAVSVTGDATGAARVPLSLKGDRLLDVISQAGGVKSKPNETFVRLTRGKISQSVSLQTILTSPQENVFVRPGDTIYVYQDTPKFTVLGAVTQQKDFPIDQSRLPLSQAVARAGGLVDIQADPGAIFLFRFEKRDVVRILRPTSRFLSVPGGDIPVIYRLSLTSPEDYFLSQKFMVRDGDLIYVANAQSVQVSKFLTLLKAFMSNVSLARGGAVSN
ncbi:sugar ABC transporter substrate-binding protein [Labrys miyagiensis]